MQEKIEDIQTRYANEDRIATQKDLRILSLEMDAKMVKMQMDLEIKILSSESRLLRRLGAIMVACSSIIFGLLMYFQK